MFNLFHYLISQPSPELLQIGLCFMRIAIGILTIGHGFPKIIGGVGMWRWLGSTVIPLGISFLPVMWGFLAACTEFFGGIALVAWIWHTNSMSIFNNYDDCCASLALE